jgi:hypothetical protein
MTKRETKHFALLLVLVSVALYGVLHWLFHRTADVAFYTLLDLAFLPVQILLLYFVVERSLAERERRGRRHKLNMVIGAFFSAVGRRLLELLTEMGPEDGEVYARLAVDPDWDAGRLREAVGWVEGAHFQLRAEAARLAPLREFLASRRDFLLRLLENPALLEHERFSDLLWAVSHLEEELAARGSLESLPPSDLAHLGADAERAYARLLAQWLEYMIHLKRFYPYLFSFAARANSLRKGARVEVG